MSATNRIAYFCMEYGLHEELPIYSGGLGILAGDTLKAAQDQQRAFAAVGIFWSEGYTYQRLNGQGEQCDEYIETPRAALVPLPTEVAVKIGQHEVVLRGFRVDRYGNAPLYLLEPRDAEFRWMTRRLYSGDAAVRVAQELILGVGGVRFLQALGFTADIYHFNEGHAVFAGLELIRQEMAQGKTFAAAREAVRRRIVFTTHTPVEAGNETHALELLLQQGVGLGTFTAGELAELAGDPFHMTVAGLRLAGVANAVSQVHGETARKMWQRIQDSAPLVAITNGVHVPTWQDARIRACSHDAPAVWQVHQELKRELIEAIEQRNGVRLAADNLLIGFARRAATYKRATLLLRDLEWLAPKLVAQKIQLVLAGKAHPNDTEGKRMIQKIVGVAKRFPQAIVYLENYDQHLGRLLTRGCDVWLNTPRRPMEASGTSGMKAALNGLLNVGVLDGWWAEGCDHGRTGWQVGDGSQELQPEAQDAQDLRALQRVLDDEVLPTYYQQRERWQQMMQAAITMSSTQFSADRMLHDYYRHMYGQARC